jgi:HlyD family secretion protein
VTIVYDERRDVLAVSNAALRFRPPPALVGSSSAEGGHRGHRPHGSAASASSAGDPPEPREGKDGKDGKDAPPPKEAKTVWVMRGATPQLVTVHAGLTDGTVTEILDGDLKAGEQVVVDSTGPDEPGPSNTSHATTRRLF